jgi:hypothetical protein
MQQQGKKAASHPTCQYVCDTCILLVHEPAFATQLLYHRLHLLLAAKQAEKQ